MEFTRRLGSCATLDELAPQLVDATAETLGATGAVLYLSHGADGDLRAAAAIGTGCPAPIVALSGLSESALKRLDDRDFRRDAVDTVAQTVTHMKSLLGRLHEPPLGDPFGGRT